MSLPSIPSSFKSKSFWERPEGNTGLVTLGLLGLGGFFVGKAVLPSVISVIGMAITAVGQMITLGAMCGVAALLLYLVMNKQVQTLTGYMFKSFMRSITQVFVEIDPIGIMKNYIDDAKSGMGKIDEGIAKLNGQVTICRRKIEQNSTAAEQALRTAKAAHQKGSTAAFTVSSRQAGRLEKSNLTLSQLHATMNMHLRAMQKYRDVSAAVIADLENEVSVREDERKMIVQSHSVMQAAKRIMNGDQDKRELFDQAMEFVANDYSQKLGEIENFIQDSRGFVESLDIQNDVYEAEALEKIKAWEAKADAILLGGPTEQPIAMLPAPASAEIDYARLFNKP